MTYRFLVPKDLGVNVLRNMNALLGNLRDWHLNLRNLRHTLRMLGSLLLQSLRDHFPGLRDLWNGVIDEKIGFHNLRL